MMDWIKLVLVVLIHGIGVIINGIAILVLPILPCYMYWIEPTFLSVLLGTCIACALISFLIRLAVAPDCPVTNYENKLRKRLGLKRIGGFIGHYFIKPFRKRRCHHANTRRGL